MMLLGSEDQFRTQMQETGKGLITVTATDDMCVVVDRIREVLAPLGIEPRMFPHPGGFTVVPR